MGLERLSAVLQHVHANYEIDLFQALIKAAMRETGEKDIANPSLRVIADHIRACGFLVCDGVIPENAGRGYVLRRIARRAMRHGYKLGQKKPFFYKLVDDLAKVMGDAFPEIAQHKERVKAVLKQEEERFGETLEKGMEILNASLAQLRMNAVKSGASPNQTIGMTHGVNALPVVLPGEVAFQLYDTFGFPVDLTADIGRESGFEVDMEGFDKAMASQQERSRSAGKFSAKEKLTYEGAKTDFKGYESLDATGNILALYRDGAAVKELKAGDIGVIVLDKTPFYAESGGQVGDVGLIATSSSTFEVGDTQKIQADVFGHYGKLVTGNVKVGDAVKASVNLEVRARTIRHHSATHLMHKALREVLGGHVQQKGSLVDADKTRFDFAHNAPMTSAQIAQVEAIVNAEILKNESTSARVMSMEAAQKTGAMMLFGEKYGDEVRVLEIGSSKELCGGTHVARTGDIGLFKIVSEGGVAAGVRRVEAVAGSVAFEYVQSMNRSIENAAALLKAQPNELESKIAHTLEHVKSLEKQLSTLKSKLASSQGDDLLGQAQDVGGVKVLVAKLEGVDAKALRETLDQVKAKLKSGVIVLAVVEGDKVQIAAGVTADLIGKYKAGDVVNHVAQQVGGKGGGKPDMAMAGGTNPAGLAAALASVAGFVKERA
jgi:alanyl-tRNA synthetase